jgi:predicted O-methyltransferase YrrM
MEYTKPHTAFDNIILKNFGRRPTSCNDIKGLLTLIHQSQGNFLEIGTWYGKTTYELATRFPMRTFYTVDFLEIQLEYECAMTTRASKDDLCKYAKDLPNVEFHYVKSQKFNYQGKNIGMVFIDGDHGYRGVKTDTELALKNLSRGGIIAWHDSFHSCFAVKKYLETEIDPFCERKAFEKSQVSYIQT